MKIEENDRLNLLVYALRAQVIIERIGQHNYNEIVRLKTKEMECQKQIIEKMKLDITKNYHIDYDTGEIIEQKLEVKDAEHI